MNTQFLSSTKKWLTLLSLLLLLTSQALIAVSGDIPSITLTQRQVCDLELIMNGGFAPLESFMNRQDYESVVNDMRLANGAIWPIPIALDIQEKTFAKIGQVPQISLRDQEGFVLAVLQIEEVWKPNRLLEAEKVYGTTSLEHPGVSYLLNQTGDYYLSGKLTKVQAPQYVDFVAYRKTPEELKDEFKKKGYRKVIAFQTHQPLHRSHLELAKRMIGKRDAHFLIHPAVGMTQPGDIDHFTRTKCYQKLLPYLPEGSATLNLLPIAMRMAGPREALWQAIVQKNYGATHFIVAKNETAEEFYEADAAQKLVSAHAKEIGIKVIHPQEFVYVKEDHAYQPIDKVSKGKTILTISNQEFRKMLNEGAEIPAWFSFPEIIAELQKVYPPRSQQGFTLFFTGLSGSGKSTIAKRLAIKLMEIQDRPVTILDGDIIRTHLSSELGFSKEHRSINVRRVGFVASEITKNRGIAVCPMIAPYEKDRQFNRDLVNAVGNFIEIYVSTPIEECENRDTKGFYALAKEGKITGFTGVNDPYEEPKNPEIIIDTTKHSIAESVEIILNYLRSIKHIGE